MSLESSCGMGEDTSAIPGRDLTLAFYVCRHNKSDPDCNRMA